MVDWSGLCKNAARHFLKICLAAVLGFVGGAFCGAAILSLCGLAGRTQTTGAEHIGYWHYGLLLVGAMYGAPTGAIAGPISYLLVLRTTGFKRAILPATAGTIIGGFAGSLYAPPAGWLTGLIGFFIALVIVRLHHPSELRRLSP